jgi:hypothetical protein
MSHPQLLASLPHKSLALMAALGIAAVNSPSVQADLCFHYPNHQFGALAGTLVAKGATPPAENTCETLAMYEVDGPDKGLEGSAIGVVCRNSTKVSPNNDPMFSFYFVYNACLGPGKFEAVTCQLKPHGQVGVPPLPTVSSSCRGVTSMLSFGDGLAPGHTIVHSYVVDTGDPATEGVLDSCQNVNTDLVIHSDTADCSLAPPPLPPKLAPSQHP